MRKIFTAVKKLSRPQSDSESQLFAGNAVPSLREFGTLFAR
jgi:hypothetical protein